MDQALKLAFVTETYSPEVNGVAMTVGHLVSGLRERGHQITVVRPRQIRGELPFANEVLVAGLPIPGYAGLRVGLPAAGTLSKRWQAERPDVVHIVTEGPLGWSALRAARRLGLPVTSGYHTNFDRYSRHYGASLMTGTIARWLHHFHRQTDITLVPTQELAKELAIHAIPGLSVVGRGVDTVQFSPMRRDPALRSSWGVEENGLAVLYVGRLAPEKNLGLVEAAYRQIAAHRPGTRMIWVGDGPSRERLQRAHPDHHFARARYGIALATH